MGDRMSLVRLTLGLYAGAVVARVLSQMLAQPHRAAPADLVSFATLNGLGAATNLVPVAAGIAVAVGIPLLLERASRGGPPLRLDLERILAFAVLVLLGSFVVGRCFGPTDASMRDPFHEGEYLAFAPAFRGSAHGFDRLLLIHGFGMNVLPGLVGEALGGADAAIAPARFIRMLFSCAALAGILWVAVEAARGMRPKATAPQLLLAPLAVALVHPLYTTASGPRAAVSAVQLALLVRVLRRELADPRSPSVGLLTPLLAFTAPLAILYNQAEALGFCAALGAAWVMAFVIDRGAYAPFRQRILLGAVAGCIALLVLVGPQNAWTIGEQVAYWSKYGGRMWLLPLGALEGRALTSLYFLVAVWSCVILAFVIRARQTSARAALREGRTLWVVAAYALATSKTWLDRSDEVHLQLAVLPAAAAATATWALFTAVRARASEAVRLLDARTAAWVLLGCLLAGLLAPFDPLAAARNAAGAIGGLGARDSRVVPEGMAAAVRKLGPSLEGQSCFFTLTSEGVWYHLFRKPSCSRFHHLVYARAGWTQREIVDDLERKRPQTILFGSSGGSNAIDGVPVSASHPIVLGHVLRHYRPGETVSGHWFWRRVESASFARAPDVQGSIERTELPPEGRIGARGTVIPPPGAAAVVLLADGAPVDAAPLSPTRSAAVQFEFNVLPQTWPRLSFAVLTRDGALHRIRSGEIEATVASAQPSD
jgi:hypothetical protein